MTKKELLWKASQFCFQTGSYFFGCKNWDDKDFCILEKDWKNLNVPEDFLLIKDDFKDYDDLDFVSEKMKVDNIIYNFIICKPKRFKSMKFATDILKQVPIKMIENKKDRVDLFVYLREFAEKGHRL